MFANSVPDPASLTMTDSTSNPADPSISRARSTGMLYSTVVVPH